MTVNDVVIFILAVFLFLGAADHCLGNKWGLGKPFAEGFMAMGPLALSMVGIVSLAPVLAAVLIPVVSPVYTAIGADPASFANTILAIDMGGYALSGEMAKDPDAGVFSWVFLGTMMGPAIVFTIPVALSIIEKEDHPYFAKGILIGISTVPIGCFIGGLAAGFDIGLILKNLIIPIVFSAVIAFGLWRFPEYVIRIFHVFGKAVGIAAIIGLAAISIETLTGIVLIPHMTKIETGIHTVGTIAIVLAGAFPMVAFITKTFDKPIGKIGSLLKLDQAATAGLVASLAHHIPMLMLVKKMSPRGKVINVAFAVSGAFVLGSHLGFVAAMKKEMAIAMIIGKLAGGITAVVAAAWATPSYPAQKNENRSGVSLGQR
ncbi:ethanolamine utilization protein EutH [Bacillus atrophaeus]|uniref:ethanolamine utilization protein EutH n=1 Tax=Bacillus atrophaeus TaxID=1452 RepID=UPI002281DE64|nr:ethanolamine utilization protein EutH [Bacillus atrophaeus]MCY9105953.1 ethanolamine utilization protein EutH [Bacillus atrophaeus]